jgi:hypothetical protein
MSFAILHWPTANFAAIANSSGCPLIYGLLAATNPVHLFPSSVFCTSSFPHFHIISFTVPYRCLYLCKPTLPLTDIIIQSFICALQALRHPNTETKMQLCCRSGCLSTIIEILPETSFNDSEALNDDHVPQECMRGHESSAAPNSDLEVGKWWWFYFRHSMSGAMASLSMCKPVSNSPAVDVVSHIWSDLHTLT